mmetsp:Transcript_1332/g.2816  ORF Transcript_1332/g.2816 Transcript_1332/m.2816 type:complete len:204 (+) Transcript_1332:3-614(+)
MVNCCPQNTPPAVIVNTHARHPSSMKISCTAAHTTTTPTTKKTAVRLYHSIWRSSPMNTLCIISTFSSDCRFASSPFTASAAVLWAFSMIILYTLFFSLFASRSLRIFWICFRFCSSTIFSTFVASATRSFSTPSILLTRSLLADPQRAVFEPFAVETRWLYKPCSWAALRDSIRSPILLVKSELYFSSDSSSLMKRAIDGIL